MMTLRYGFYHSSFYLNLKLIKKMSLGNFLRDMNTYCELVCTTISSSKSWCSLVALSFPSCLLFDLETHLGLTVACKKVKSGIHSRALSVQFRGTS